MIPYLAPALPLPLTLVLTLRPCHRIGDSDQIVKYIEEKYPEPKLGTPESTSDACAPSRFRRNMSANIQRARASV